MNKLRTWPRLASLLPKGLVCLCLLVGLLVGCGASSSQPSGPTPTSTKQITEFPIPTSPGTPIAITAGPDGNLWFTENAANKIGRIAPSGTITEFALPSANSGPTGITAGPDGALWFTACVLDSSFACTSNSKIGRITSGGKITEFALPSAKSSPLGITVGPDGALWFTESMGNRIGRITPSGTITEFPIPTSQSSPIAITAGPDGNLWFTESGANKIGRITPSGTISEFSVPTSASDPEGITKGPDGNLWFTENGANKIGQITPK